jgi:hypothetical protein
VKFSVLATASTYWSCRRSIRSDYRYQINYVFDFSIRAGYNNWVGERHLGWVRFAASGKLRAQRWHLVKHSPLGGYVTLCGHYVGDTRVAETRGDELDCETCRQRWLEVRGGHI